MLDELLPAFLADYPSLMREARQKLGTMYKEEDYPTVTNMRDKFVISPEYTPVPRSDFNSAALSSGLLAEMERDLEERIQRSTQQAMGDAWNRLFTCVENLHERLATPGAIFRDSLVDNVKECCDVLKRLNVVNDPQLERMRANVEDQLGRYGANVLRNSDRLRGNTATAAETIMNQIRGTGRVIRTPKAEAEPVAA